MDDAIKPLAWMTLGGAMQLAKDGQAYTILRCFDHDEAKDTPLYDRAALDAAVAAAVAAERERCARICEETWVEPGDLQTCNCQAAADAIRAGLHSSTKGA
jgi:hypothetical protein